MKTEMKMFNGITVFSWYGPRILGQSFSEEDVFKIRSCFFIFKVFRVYILDTLRFIENNSLDTLKFRESNTLLWILE